LRDIIDDLVLQWHRDHAGFVSSEVSPMKPVFLGNERPIDAPPIPLEFLRVG
jgi:hypothetical protein